MITAAMLEPITTAITSSLEIVVPVGLGVMAAIYGVRLVPRFLKMFI